MEFSRVAEVTFDNPLIGTSNDVVSQGLEIHMTEEDRERLCQNSYVPFM